MDAATTIGEKMTKVPHRYSRMSFAESAASQQSTPHRAVFRPLKHGDMTPFTIEAVK